MKTYLTLALLAAMISAQSENSNGGGNGGGNDQSEEAKQRRFNEFAAKYNKQYSSVEEMGKRRREFDRNENKIAELQRKNDEIGEDVRFAINSTGDLTEDELRQSQGLGTQHLPERPSQEEIDQATDDKFASAGLGDGRRRM